MQNKILQSNIRTACNASGDFDLPHFRKRFAKVSPSLPCFRVFPIHSLYKTSILMENTKQILTTLKKNPNIAKAKLSELTGVKGIILYNLLRSLKTEGKIIEFFDGTETVYALADTPAKEEKAQTEVENSAKEEKQETEPEKPKVSFELPAPSRDNSKYKFQGEDYGKGPLVRAVISQYVADNPGMTYKKLKEAFPDDLLKRFGIFQDIDTATGIDPTGKRYFFKEENIIKLKDKKVVVCNQFTLANIQPFLAKAKELGYKIK